MKIKNIVFFAIIFLLSLLLTSFSHWKNQHRFVKITEVIFESGSPKFLSIHLVDKMLKQNLDILPKKIKEGLDLNILELLIEKNPYVSNAEVFYYPEGSLGVKVKEQKPEVKILSDSSYYYNAEGLRIPLSDKFNPDVPVFIGKLEKHQKEDLLFLITNFKEDDFLKNQLKEIRYEWKSYYIKLHSFDFEIEFGSTNNIKEKIKKLKVFSAFQKRTKRKLNFKKINLKYNKQIVAS